MIILVTGDRNWSNRKSVKRELESFPQARLVIQGGAAGADTLAKEEAEKLGIQVCTFHANWELQHRSAGPIRNSNMIRFIQPDLVLAFHPDLDSSAGTADMVKKAKSKGIPVRLIKK